MPSVLSAPPGAAPASRSLLLQIGHEQVPPLLVEAEVVDAEHAHAEADLGADRVELRVEGLLGDAELGDPHRHDRGCLLQTNSVSGASIGTISSVPAPAERVVVLQLRCSSG